MADIEIAGIMRAGAYSPNHIGNDAAIFHATVDELRRRGYKVNLYSEEQFCNLDVSESVVLNMCRTRESIDKLQQLEDAGRLVINSGYGIQNCIRERMTDVLLGAGIPYPESVTIDTNQAVTALLERHIPGPCWVKRGESHTVHKEDISYCRHSEEAQEVIKEYCYRGIKRAVINKHLPGDLVKFYGVAGTEWFHWFYPYDAGHGKYGYEETNGTSKSYAFDLEELKGICSRAATVMDITIYGGDCIISEKGDISIIDFNDWPSFAPIRTEAARVIARAVISMIKKYIKERRYGR